MSDPFRSPLYWAAFISGLAWSVILWVRSPRLSSPLDDEIGHYLISRDAWSDPSLALHLWGRAANTIAYMPAALFGLEPARAFSLLLAGATVLVATRVAQLLGARSLALVPVLLWFQPWFHTHAFATLTELPFALAMIAACWAWLTDRPRLTSLLVGVLPLIRHEGVIVLGLWGLWLLHQRQWPLIPIAIAPFLAYHAAYSLAFSEPPFAVYFGTEPTRRYGEGGWLHFALPLARSVGVVAGLLAVVGLLAYRRERRLMLMAVPYGVYVLLQVVFFRFGLFASAGYTAFLLPVAPFAAVAATLGADRLIEIARRQAPGRVAAAVPVVLALAAIANGLRSEPLQPDPAAAPMQQAVRFLERRGLDSPAVTSTHVWFYELSGQQLPARADEVDGFDTPWSQPRSPRALPPGSVVVWDCYYSDRFGLRWRDLQAAGFRELSRFGAGTAVVLRRGGPGWPPGTRPRCAG